MVSVASLSTNNVTVSGAGYTLALAVIFLPSVLNHHGGKFFLTSPIFKAAIFIQAAHELHVFIGQTEIEDVKVLGDVIFI